MSQHFRFNFFALVILCFAIALIFSTENVAANKLYSADLFSIIVSDTKKYTEEDVNQVLAYIAEKGKISKDNLILINQHVRNYPTVGKDYLYVKVLDRYTYQISDAVLDLGSKKNKEVNEVEQIEKEAKKTKFGKLEPSIYDAIKRVSDDEKLDVAIWLKSDDTENIIPDLQKQFPKISSKTTERPWLVVDVRDSGDAKKKYIEAKINANLSSQNSIFQWIIGHGYSATLHPSLPCLTAKLPKGLILELEKFEDVETIYSINGEIVNQLQIAIPTIKADKVWELGITGKKANGTSEVITILEWDTVQMPHNGINVIGVRKPNVISWDPHASEVASAAASHNPTLKGVAPDASILSAGFYQSGSDYSDVDGAINWAFTNGSTIMNSSWSTDSGEGSDDMEWVDRVFDYYASHYNITMVAASGNQRLGNHVGSPAKGYNVLAIGGFDDHRTVTWDDDTFWELSSWKNPKTSNGTYGDREKPEVVAPAVNLSMLDNSNQTISDTGTSFASPQVSGLIALLHVANNNLNTPEAMRAIVLASAWNNIDGPSGIPTGNDLRDGAGGVDTLSAVSTAKVGYYSYNAGFTYPYPICEQPCWWSEYTYTNNPNSSNEFRVGNYRYYDIKVNRGERIRVAVSWNSIADGPGNNFGSDFLGADLDLVVFDPNYNFAPGGYSASHDNNYELIDFVAEKTGVYHIGIYKRSSSYYMDWIGLAWSRVDSIYMPLVSSNGGANGSTELTQVYPAPMLAPNSDQETPVYSGVEMNPYPAP